MQWSSENPFSPLSFWRWWKSMKGLDKKKSAHSNHQSHREDKDKRQVSKTQGSVTFSHRCCAMALTVARSLKRLLTS